MRFEIIRQVFQKEWRETLRDRRSLAVMFGVPLIVYPLLILITASISQGAAQRVRQQKMRVAVVNAGDAPHLVAEIERRDSGLRLARGLDEASEARRALDAKRVDAVLVVPPNAEADALASRPVSIRVLADNSRPVWSAGQKKIDLVLQKYQEQIIAQRLEARGVPATLVRPIKTTRQDTALPDRRLRNLMISLLPMMLLLTGALGAFFPAINVITSERELGTLESLLVTPAAKMELLLGKVALVLLSALLTAGLNMLSMALVLWRTMSQATALAASNAAKSAGSGDTAAAPPPLPGIDFGALALAYVAAVPTIVFVAALCLVVALFARNYKEANSYATPVFFLALVPTMMNLTEARATPALLATPAVNSSLVIRDVLNGQVSTGAFALAFLSSCLYAGLMLSVAARLFSSENLVNPAWEPLSFKGLRRDGKNGRPAPRRLPAVDEALALGAVSLLLVFYIQPSLQPLGLLPMLAGNELLLIAAPALLFAWMFRYRWRETFAWRKPLFGEMLGATLLGIGLAPCIAVLAALQSHFFAPDPAKARATAELFVPALQSNPWLTPIAVGVLAGVCEEILFRGPIQTALARRLPMWAALGVGGFLFAAFHLDSYGLALRTLIGMILGWLVLRGGSVFPAMLLHAVYDAVLVGFSAFTLHRFGPEQFVKMTDRPDALLQDELAKQIFGGAVVAGPFLVLAGWMLCRSAHRHKARAEQQHAAQQREVQERVAQAPLTPLT